MSASTTKDFPVVCVGGSAGGLDAYIRFLSIRLRGSAAWRFRILLPGTGPNATERLIELCRRRV